MNAHELQARSAAKAAKYGEMAATTRDNAYENARTGGSASYTAELRGMQRAYEEAARDFATLAGS